MNRTWIGTLIVLAAGAVSHPALAQQHQQQSAPAGRTNPQAARSTSPSAPEKDVSRRTAYRPTQGTSGLHYPNIPTDPAHPDYYEPAHRSVIRHNPLRTYGSDSQNQTYGFRNPGGVGRYAEFYPPGDQFQNQNSRRAPAKFDEGPEATRRSSQIASYSAGTARYQAIQGSINSYARPNFGFGIGFNGGVFSGMGR